MMFALKMAVSFFLVQVGTHAQGVTVAGSFQTEGSPTKQLTSSATEIY